MGLWLKILAFIQVMTITAALAMLLTLSERSGWMNRQNEITDIIVKTVSVERRKSNEDRQRIERLEKAVSGMNIENE